MSDTDKKYLFVIDLSKGRDFADSVIEIFMCKAFLTNSILVLLTNDDKQSSDYMNYTYRKIFGGGGSKASILADKSN